MNLFEKVIFLVILTLNRNVTSDEELSNTTNNMLQVPYCFRFTWLGPQATKESLENNATCDDLNLRKTDPCRLPLVVTDNTNIPNTTWLWKKYENNKIEEIACRLVKSDVCAKITFSYNQQVENITYLCTKVSIDGEGAAPLGCYVTDLGSGRQTEVCTCESSAGKEPCNEANSRQINVFWKYFTFTMTIYSLFTFT
ncbi:uncharacterized protein LOC129612586 [Condylostylus longicornis]|uniref:uncharacterized protein LOC129612586 n=1 Tax=Condylostylus longicornis TaxID=2530218 RepID=UPI00244E47F0|nr:uncharacterized protein LOC129612586 [Condylostylus longicornis]